MRQSLLVFEAGSDVAELLVYAEAFLLLVVAVADVADEDGQPPHPRERHPSLGGDPAQICSPPREIWPPRRERAKPSAWPRGQIGRAHV